MQYRVLYTVWVKNCTPEQRVDSHLQNEEKDLIQDSLIRCFVLQKIESFFYRAND